MTVSSDPDTYGEMMTYVVQGERPDGPVRVASQAESEPAISREISLQDNVESGTQVRFGDLQFVPVADSLLYVRPFYVEVQQPGPIPLVTEFRFVITSFGERATYAPTLGQALARLFPGFSGDIGDRITDDRGDFDEVGEFIDPDDGTVSGGFNDDQPLEPDEPSRPVLDETADAAALLAEAEALFLEAELQLRATGDLGTYQATIEQARDLVTRALDLIAGVG